MTETVNGWDAIGGNLHLVPASEGPYGGGYLTGFDPVPWTPAQMAAHPQAVLFDQSPTNTPFDTTCDAFDVEANAVTAADIIPGIHEARDNFNKAVRPGQRWPAIYCSRSRLTELVNDLIAGGITSCPFIIADYGNQSEAEAAAEVASSSGPFPIVGRQWSDKGGGDLYDLDVWSLPWLNNRSKKVSDVTVPNVVAMSAGSAHNTIAAANLIPTAPPGQKATDLVLFTAPAPGASVPEGTPVLIIGASELSIVINGHTFDLKL